MCLIIATIFLVLAIQAFMQNDTKAFWLYGAIALFFYLLMILNIRRVWKKRHEEA